MTQRAYTQDDYARDKKRIAPFGKMGGCDCEGCKATRRCFAYLEGRITELEALVEPGMADLSLDGH